MSQQLSTLRNNLCEDAFLLYQKDSYTYQCHSCYPLFDFSSAVISRIFSATTFEKFGAVSYKKHSQNAKFILENDESVG